VAVSVGGVAAALTREVSAVTVPLPLIDATVEAATRFAAGSTAAAAVSATVVSLTEGVLKTMLLTKLKVVVAAAITLGVVLTSAGVMAQSGSTGGADRYASDPQPATARQLQAMEQKLDRVLEALDAARRPGSTQATTPSAKGSTSQTSSGDTYDSQAKSATTPYVVSGGALPQRVTVDSQVHATTAETQDRLKLMEHRINQVERSLAEVMGRLDRLEGEARNAAPPNQRGQSSDVRPPAK
jgi:RNA polymerase sigma-70 factor (ECF subfamily)